MPPVSAPSQREFSRWFDGCQAEGDQDSEVLEPMRDPVCGMELGARDAVASAVAGRRRFYFCCLRCHAAFLDTPHRFAGWPGGPCGRPQAAVSTRTGVGPEPCHLSS